MLVLIELCFYYRVDPFIPFQTYNLYSVIYNNNVVSSHDIVLWPRPHLFLEVGLVNNEHFPGCAESACHMISIAMEVRL